MQQSISIRQRPCTRLVAVLLFLWTRMSVSNGSSTRDLSATTTSATMTVSLSNNNRDNDDVGVNSFHNVNEITMVFSDLDGTLLHYPSQVPKSRKSTTANSNINNRLLKLPPSSTGMQAIISSRTLFLIQEIRKRNSHRHRNQQFNESEKIKSSSSNNNNSNTIKFVLVSGMRTTTFLNRLPYLPKADAYCTEAGGRIFYPISIITSDDDKNNNNNMLVIQPQPFDGATPDDLKPFGIVEDMEWRARIEQVAGPYPPTTSLQQLAVHQVTELKERDGLLWDFARDLVGKGLVVDTKGYSACFRVNRKQQDSVMVVSNEMDLFEALLNGNIQPFEGLTSSVNLSCIDFYPANSGKKNCCLYLTTKFFPNDKKGAEQLLKEHAVCLCDDDNDLEMAMACGHAYVPEISSSSMKDIIDRYPDHFTQTGGEGIELSGTDSTEAALLLVLKRLDKETQPDVVPNGISSSSSEGR